MQPLEADVAIVGAGPAGTAAAIHLAQLGIRNVLLVDRADFPREKTCGSAVSPKGIQALQRLGVWEKVRDQSYWITGLRLVTPGGREMVLSGGDSAAAIICCRRTLDHLLLQRALTLGVRFVPNFYVQSLILREERTLGFAALDGRAVHARYTVIADGSHSRFTVNPKPQKIIQAIMGWWEKMEFRAHHVEMIFGGKLTPYYGWLFPESDVRVNIGICYEDLTHTRNARHVFGQFLDANYGSRLAGAHQVGDWKGHQISYCYQIERLYSPGRIIAGEAGRMTHPGTAEGIYQGMLSGMLAAETLLEILSGATDELRGLAAYESRCRHAFAFSFGCGKVWREIVASPVLDWIASVEGTRIARRALARVMARM